MKKKLKIVLLGLAIIIIAFIIFWLFQPKFTKDNVGTYYKKANGTYATNEWVKSFFDWYYFDANGYMAKGQIVPGEFFTDIKTGKMMKNNWLFVNNGYYFFGKDGKMVRDNWVKFKNKYYYLLPSGSMAINQWVDNYYVGQDGAMLTNTVTPDGNSVGGDGKIIAVGNVQNQKAPKTSNVTAKNNTKISHGSNDLYNEIISNIPDNKNTYDMVEYQPNGVLSFWGYQLFDANGDGIDELFIYRNGYRGRFFIDEAYTIKNNKAVIFDVGVGVDGVRSNCYTGATRDDVWYSLIDGKIAFCSYHWGSIDEMIIIDPKINKKEQIVYDTTISETGWAYNGNPISAEEADSRIIFMENQIGYFYGCELKTKDNKALSETKKLFDDSLIKSEKKPQTRPLPEGVVITDKKSDGTHLTLEEVRRIQESMRAEDDEEDYYDDYEEDDYEEDDEE